MNDSIREKQKSIIIEVLWRFVFNKHSSKPLIRFTDNSDIADEILKELSALIEAEKIDQCHAIYKAVKEANTPDKRTFEEAEKEPPVYDENYLLECIEKARPNLSKIKDVDKWIDEIRGISEKKESIFTSELGMYPKQEKKSPEEILKQVFQIDKLPKHRLILSANEIMELMLIYAEQ
jgi:hypothetical protein